MLKIKCKLLYEALKKLTKQLEAKMDLSYLYLVSLMVCLKTVHVSNYLTMQSNSLGVSVGRDYISLAYI